MQYSPVTGFSGKAFPSKKLVSMVGRRSIVLFPITN